MAAFPLPLFRGYAARRPDSGLLQQKIVRIECNHRLRYEKKPQQKKAAKEDHGSQKNVAPAHTPTPLENMLPQMTEGGLLQA